MSEIENNDKEIIPKRKPGRPSLTEEEALQRYRDKKEKAKERYYQNTEKCAEQSRENQKRYREFYRYMKDLVKNNKINLPEDIGDKIRELLLLNEE